MTSPIGFWSIILKQLLHNGCCHRSFLEPEGTASGLDGEAEEAEHGVMPIRQLIAAVT